MSEVLGEADDVARSDGRAVLTWGQPRQPRIDGGYFTRVIDVASRTATDLEFVRLLDPNSSEYRFLKISRVLVLVSQTQNPSASSALHVPMPKRNDSDKPTAPARDQPGNNVALLIIDMINPFDFEGAKRLLPKARRAARVILKLRKQADSRGMPVIYVNDNFGEWHSEKSRLVDRTSDRIAPELAPREKDYFIIKPQFSGFYATNLPVLLPKLGVRRLVLTGVATDICVLFTAADAHMRDYALWIPEDAVAAESDERAGGALAIIRAHMGGETAPTRELGLADWQRATSRTR